MDELIEVSGSGGGSKPGRSAAAAYESFDNMGKEKVEEKEELWESDLCGFEAGSDDDEEEEEEEVCDDDDEEEEEEEVCEDPMEPDCEDRMEPDCEDPMEPDCEDSDSEDTGFEDIVKLMHPISEDDSDGLKQLLNLPKDSGIGQKDPHYDYEKPKHAFGLSTYYNKLCCLKALLDSGVDWFAVVGEKCLLSDIIIADSKNAAALVIAYAKKNKVGDKLLGAIDDMGMTPLHSAAYRGSCNVIQLLLEEGADPCKPDANGKLPCDYANPGTKAKKLLVDALVNKVRVTVRS